ncbi:hypothetical protein F5884DRAFT_830864 [Xylogone sp. PMI_703]|nr:hypothetical protein F5884DRAFT_830864 [Xylogone sp. PMI_703]
MTSPKEAEQFLLKVWDAAWTPGLPDLSEYYVPDAAVSAYSPPKQTTWKGLDAIKGHFEEMQPMVSPRFFNITHVDVVNGGSAYYATFEAEFDVRVPGQEGVMEGRGIIHCILKDGKVAVWTMYEDPTPFIELALRAQKA